MADTDERVGWVPVEGRDYAPTYDQIAKQRHDIEAKQSSGAMWSAVLDDTQLLMGGKRVFDRNFTDFKPEEGFSISKEQHDEIRKEFGDEQTKDIVDGVMSPGELNSRMGYYREDIKRKREISSYGWRYFL